MNTPQVAIIDYNVGNLLSVSRAFSYCNAKTLITREAKEIKDADFLVLPGTGAFGDCTNFLETNGLKEAILDFIRSGKSVLGICVGMQILFEKGYEFGCHNGLGIIEGDVKKIEPKDKNNKRLKVPHMGWGKIELSKNKDSCFWNKTILKDVAPNSYVYFVHSFAAEPKTKDFTLAEVYYGETCICATIQKENVIGTQFHPEKSGQVGINIINNFLLNFA